MPRSIWNGSISFGLVNVPVQLYSAIEAKDIHFNQFSKSGHRIKYKRVDEKTGREVEWRDIQKGYELSKGRHVMVSSKELESVEPGRSRTIEIEDFVDLHEIDPIYFQTTYYVGAGKGADKAYVLLRQAMERSERIGVARFVFRTKQYLAAIRPSDRLLLLSTMYYPDEIRESKDISVPSGTRVAPKEMQIAEQLIDSLTVPWKPEKYTDTYRERVLDLVKRKSKGKEIVVDREEEEPSKVVDLFEALQASLAANKGTGSRRKASTSRTKKRTRKAS